MIDKERRRTRLGSATPEGRRPVTVLFSDLAESTKLAQRLEPEDLQDYLNTYYRQSREAVERFAGLLVQTQGDGIICVFGWPKVQEDAAERAVRAGFAIIEAVSNLPPPVPGERKHIARVGIATGMTLTAQPSGSTGAVDLYGTVPSLAARLQALAPPGGMLVSETTRRRLGNRFRCRDLGRQDVKGFDQPIGVWQVIEENLEGTRFLPARGAAGGLLSGRDAELERLLALWQAARDGQGGLLLLEGEAGIGKSRLVSEFIARVAPSGERVIQLQCLPLFEATALHPIAELLRVTHGLQRNAAPGEQRERLLGEFRRAGLFGAEAESACALLGLDDPAGGAVAVSDRERAQVLEALAAWLLDLGQGQPLCLVLEDAHWADPTTLELVERLAQRVAGSPVLVIVTSRDTRALARRLPAAERLQLQRLGDRDAAVLLAALSGDRPLPPQAASELLAKAEGIPFYLEELAEALQHKERLDLPESLQDALLSRVEALPGVRGVADATAVLGGMATADLVSEVTGEPAEAVTAALHSLSMAGILVQVPTADEEQGFRFRHALLQDAVYGAITRRRLRLLHGQAARAIRHLKPQLLDAVPELVAEHLDRAEDGIEAAALWLAAGRSAAARSALREAQRHLERGLRSIADEAGSVRAADLEVALSLALAPVLLATRGPKAPEVDRLFSRARALRPRQFDAIWGLWRTETRTDRQQTLADELLQIAVDTGDRQLLLQAHHAQWATRFNCGELQASLDHVEAGEGVYREAEDGQDPARFGGHDPLSCGYGVAALSEWALGRPARARAHIEAALALARRLRDAHSLAHALDYAMTLAQHLADLPALAAYAAEAIDLADRNGLAHYLARARAFAAWHRGATRGGGDPAALADLIEAIGTLQGIGDEEDFMVFLDLLAERLHDAGRREEATALVARARGSLEERRGVRYWEPELIRRAASLQLDAEGGQGRGRARELLQEALALAEGRGHATLALRAALALVESGLDAAAGRAAVARLLDGIEGPQDLPEGRRALALLGRA